MSGIRYVIVGTPRSATAYTSELLSNLGLACGHEKYFKFEQSWQNFLDDDRIHGDATWLARPFLQKFPPNVRILHQTRDPVKVINSLLQIQFLDLDENETPMRTGARLRFTQFAYQHCPELSRHSTTLERTIWFYYYWNKAIDDAAQERSVLRFDIESLGPDLLKRILRHLGLPRDYISDEMLAAQFELLPRNINAKAREKVGLEEKVAWSDLPEDLREMAASYGYGPSDQSAERVERWSQDTVQAQNQIRNHARRVLRAWRAERSALADEVSELRGLVGRISAEEKKQREELLEARQQLADERMPLDHSGIDERESPTALGRRDHWMCRMVADGPVLDVCRDRATRCILLGREGLEVVATDCSAEVRATAQEKLAGEPGFITQNVRLTEVSAYAVESEPASFNTVILSDALTRVTKPKRLLEHVLGYLAEGGRLIISVPLGYHPGPGHTFAFCMWSLLDLLNRHCEIARVEVLQGYACVQAVKPAAGVKPRLLSDKDLAAWLRMGDEALVRVQWCWSSRHADLDASNRKLARASEQAKVEADRKLAQALKKAHAEADRLREELRGLRDQQQEAQSERDTESALLSRAQALYLRAAQSNARISKDAFKPIRPDIEKPVQQSGGFLFFCVNGAGLGHVTRSLAVARRIRRIDPAIPIYFLSSSQALRAISNEGMTAYYLPPRSEFGKAVSANDWNKLLLQHLRLIVGLHRPLALVYDGVSPYQGLLDILPEAGFMYTAMILRLRHKHGRILKSIDRLKRFDELIFPGERGVEIPSSLSSLNCSAFDPLIYLDEDELLSREQVRRHWNVPPGKKIVYVQLGAGNINDTTPWIRSILAVCKKRHDVEVVLAESPVAHKGFETSETLRIFTQYPNSLHFRGFDLAITAVGYNTFHELMHFAVPSILIPNENTVTDNQVARALTAREAGAAMVVQAPDQLNHAITTALQSEAADEMRANAAKLVPVNGAQDVAKHLLASATCAHAVPPSFTGAGASSA